MMKFSIVPLEREHIEYQVERFRDILGSLSSIDITMTNDMLQSLLYDIKTQGDIYGAINEDGILLGMITLIIQPTFFRGGKAAGHIENLVVHPDASGQGIGGALVRYTLEETKKNDCYKVILDCSSELLPFYQKYGFEQRELCMKIYL